MKEISLNILDVANNSVRAEATEICIEVRYDFSLNRLKVEIRDNGKGMSEEFLSRVTDPFTTTRTTRKVGLGLPFFRESAELTGGEFRIRSKLKEGTEVTAEYVIDSIDRMPMGDLAETMMLLISSDDNIKYILKYAVDGKEYIFDTKEVREILGDDISLSAPEVMKILKEDIKNGINEINGGREIV